MASNQLEGESQMEVSCPFPGLDEPENALEWVKVKGLLKQNRNCEKCGNGLEVLKTDDKDVLEFLKCANEECYFKIPIFDKSFFYRGGNKKNILISHWLHLIRYWCNREPQSQVIKTTKITKKYVGIVYDCCRLFCVDYFKDNPVKLKDPTTVIVKKYTLNHRTTGGHDETLYLLVMVAQNSGYKNRVGYMDSLDYDNLDLTKMIIILNEVVDSDRKVKIASDEFGTQPFSSGKFEFVKCSDDEKSIISSYYQRHYELLSTISRQRVGYKESFWNECMWRERVEGDNVFESFIADLKSFYNNKWGK